jgi:hypothetical protein
MSLKNLTKEQKQYVALGALAAAIVVILMVLGIRFSMATISEAKEELDDLTAKISNANQSLSRSRRTSEDYVETVAMLRKYLTNAPPERNYYSWATQVIYSKARIAGFEVDSIDEIPMPQQQRSGLEDTSAISFDSYSLRIAAHGGYENTKYFMNLLQQDYPLVRFSGIEISSGQSPDGHDVHLFIQWPFNFGEISKNWDSVADKKMKVAQFNDDPKVAAPKESESPDDVTSVAKPRPVLEPYPPTTRPDVEETPAPMPPVEATVPKTEPRKDAESQVKPGSFDTLPRPVTDDEGQASLSNLAPSFAERIDAEPQYPISESEAVLESQPVLQQGTDVAGAEPMQAPESFIEYKTVPLAELQAEPGSMAKPVPAVEQEISRLISEFGTPDSAPIPEEAESDTKEAAPTMDSPFAAEVEPPFDSVADAPHSDDSTGKSEKIHEDLLNKESTGKDSSLRSLLESMAGENNEK